MRLFAAVLLSFLMVIAFTGVRLSTANDLFPPDPHESPPPQAPSFKMDARDVPILMYHHLDEHPDTSGAITPGQFEEQLQWLDKLGYRSIHPDQLLDAIANGVVFSQPKVLITFDDGYRSTLTDALPLLENYGFEATLFVYTDRIQNSSGFLSPHELLDMKHRGITIASHTVSHAELTSLLAEEGLPTVLQELADSRKSLASLLGTDVTHLAFPYGAYCPIIVDAAQNAGYKGLFAIHRNRDCSDDSILQRIPVLRETTLDEFRTLLPSSGKAES